LAHRDIKIKDGLVAHPERAKDCPCGIGGKKTVQKEA
jgi:hypothetical protein